MAAQASWAAPPAPAAPTPSAGPRTTWTDDLDATLRQLVSEGLSRSKVAARMGVTAGSVEYRSRRLGVRFGITRTPAQADQLAKVQALNADRDGKPTPASGPTSSKPPSRLRATSPRSRKTCSRSAPGWSG